MFTGIITDVGRVKSVEHIKGGDTRFDFETAFDMDTVDIGASIACSGACMTVIEKGNGWFAITASAESLSKTTMGVWVEGHRVNLERALKLGDELGGHIVSGHVDGVARVVDMTEDDGSVRVTFESPEEFARFIAPKGSVVIDGVSLTVNEVNAARFSVNIIPHTQQVTTLGALGVGDAVNLEIDMLARYVARLIGKD